jgi:hypothetical protein
LPCCRSTRPTIPSAATTCSTSMTISIFVRSTRRACSPTDHCHFIGVQ